MQSLNCYGGFHEGQLGDDEYVNVIMKYLLMMAANYLWRLKKYHQACCSGLIVEWRTGCAMRTKSKIMPAFEDSQSKAYCN